MIVLNKGVLILNIVHSEPHIRGKMSKSIQISMKTNQQMEVRQLLEAYSDVLPDIPGKTNLAECNIELTDDIHL